ncbi:ABC transporter substrate-binding protein [Candidatus Bathyarchaeota archaeon]|nr:ABC transporter substrate-binding protein [Candidatus Bathyarchaeota archaeon]
MTVEKHPLDGKTVRIGYISSTTSALETTVPLVEEIIQADINEYAAKLGYGTQFEWLVDTADSQAAVHLEKAQGFKSMDVNIFQGGPWSSMAQASLGYVNDNDMLMMSSSSTSPLLAIADDRLYRTCPTDFVQAPAIGEMLESWGIEAVLILQRGDSWADGIYNILENELIGRGIPIIEKVRYAAEVTEFSSYLQTMDDKLGAAIAQYGADRVAVQTMAFDELVVIVTQTPDYPNTRKVIWMGTESSGRNQRMLDDAGGAQTQLRGFSSLMTPAKSWKWESLVDRYWGLTSTQASSTPQPTTTQRGW